MPNRLALGSRKWHFFLLIFNAHQKVKKTVNEYDKKEELEIVVIKFENKNKNQIPKEAKRNEEREKKCYT